MRRFPLDCPKDCPHFHCFSIEDAFSLDCDLLVSEQTDNTIMELYNDTFLPICPLEETVATE